MPRHTDSFVRDTISPTLMMGEMVIQLVLNGLGLTTVLLIWGMLALIVDRGLASAAPDLLGAHPVWISLGVSATGLLIASGLLWIVLNRLIRRANETGDLQPR